VRVHLVDGTFELFRAFHGAPPAAVEGREVGATRGILRSLHALLREPEVTHVAIAFDTVIESFRNEMFDGYKTGEGIDPALRAQFDLTEEVMAAAGVTVWGMIEFEADDAIATAALRWMDDVEQVVIASPDKDLMQCIVDDRVVAWDRIRDRWFDEAGVVEKFGVPPEAIPDYLALVGDTADGVPGLPGWGAKSAAAVLAHFGRLDMIPDHVGDWGMSVRSAPTLATVLREHRKEAMLYRTLTTLRRDVPLTETLDDLEWKGERPELADLRVKYGL
jgi:5'-3' exonuclease